MENGSAKNAIWDCEGCRVVEVFCEGGFIEAFYYF
jgi:hypothetical protein